MNAAAGAPAPGDRPDRPLTREDVLASQTAALLGVSRSTVLAWARVATSTPSAANSEP